MFGQLHMKRLASSYIISSYTLIFVQSIGMGLKTLSFHFRGKVNKKYYLKEVKIEKQRKEEPIPIKREKKFRRKKHVKNGF